MESDLSLFESLAQHRCEIEQSLVIGRAKWPRLIARVRDAEAIGESDFKDEQIWTFLLACVYAIAGPKGVHDLGAQFGVSSSSEHQIWFEVLPLPPRALEGNTNLDLAIGALDRRGDTRSGIRFEPSLGKEICFFEFKWYSDISVDTIHDLHRNQLARVIETAITFGDEHGKMPDKAVVALVTPAIFKNRQSPSRLYSYKWMEYSSTEAIRADLESLPQHMSIDHDYETLLGRLVLKWKSFEELVASMPSSPLRSEFADFALAHGPNLELEAGAA